MEQAHEIQALATEFEQFLCVLLDKFVAGSIMWTNSNKMSFTFNQNCINNLIVTIFILRDRKLRIKSSNTYYDCFYSFFVFNIYGNKPKIKKLEYRTDKKTKNRKHSEGTERWDEPKQIFLLTLGRTEKSAKKRSRDT